MQQAIQVSKYTSGLYNMEIVKSILHWIRLDYYSVSKIIMAACYKFGTLNKPDDHYAYSVMRSQTLR